MNVQRFLLSSFKKSLSIMGSEEIIIAGKKIQAVEDETASSNELGIGAINNERTLVVKFPADAFTGALKSGMTVFARQVNWQISSDRDSIKRGQVSTTLVLIEPERRE